MDSKLKDDLVKAKEFSPESLSNYCPLLAEDMGIFLEALTAYDAKPDEYTKWELSRKWEILMFSIKHRLVEEAIQEEFADRLKEYIGELSYEKF